MATVLPTAPAVLSDYIVQTVAGKLPILNNVSVNLSASVGRAGKTVFVPVMGAGTASEFNKSTNTLATVDGATMSNSSVTLKHFKYVDEFSPLDIQEYGMQYLINAYAKTAAQAIVDKTWAEIGSVFTAANFATEETVAAASFGYDSVVLAQLDLDTAKAGQPRSFLVGNDYLSSLRKDSKIYGSLNPSANTVVTSGNVGQVAGMDIYQWNQIPGNSENLAGVALGPDALLVATGIPMAEIAGFSSSVSTAESGLSVQVLVGQAETGNIRCIAQILVGANKGRSTSAVRFVTA
jgi:hypothetical protein